MTNSSVTQTTPKRNRPSRWLMINRISQAHLAPGMSLLKFQVILDKYRIGKNWDDVPTGTLRAIVGDVAAIVKQQPPSPTGRGDGGEGQEAADG